MDHAFTDPERAQLALLHLFQGFVDVGALCRMGRPEAEYCVPEVRGLSRQAGIALLDRAAEIGLLTAHGDGYYSIHPALPWFFHQWFTYHYGLSGQQAAIRATRAYVGTIGELGHDYHNRYETGRAEMIGVLRAEEANLLHARALGRAHSWWNLVIGAMQGLNALYGHTGRVGEWRRLVEQLVPDLVESDTYGPLSGCEEEWSFINEYQTLLARDSRKLGNRRASRAGWHELAPGTGCHCPGHLS